MTLLRLTLLCLAVVLMPAGGFAQTSTRDAAAAARLINAHRAASGLGPLRVDARLNAAAAEQVSAMVAAGTLSHDAGSGFGARMRRHGLEAAAENIAYGQRNVAEVVAAWKTSFMHNANLLKGGMTRMGLARGAARDGRPFWAFVVAR
jgi:uncharacterized protein YkwD